MLGLVSGLGGLFENIASNNLPKIVRPYLWLSWPLFILFLAIGIFLAILQAQNENETSKDIQDLKETETSPEKYFVHREETNNDIYSRLINRCSISDIKDVCFYMGIDYENYPEGKSNFVREFLLDIDRKGREKELMITLRSTKPWVFK